MTAARSHDGEVGAGAVDESARFGPAASPRPLRDGSAAYTPSEWRALWHHLCARRAEVARGPDYRVGGVLRELDRLIEVAYARSH